MDHPKCRICQQRHSLRDGCVWVGEAEPGYRPAGQKLSTKPKEVGPVGPPSPQSLEDLREWLFRWAAEIDAELERRGWVEERDEGRERDEKKRFDRREYQREYMRKWRASRKNSKEGGDEEDGEAGPCRAD